MRLLAVFLILFSFTSCHKDIPAIQNAESYPGNNYSDLFEAFWNGINNNYVYWSIDSTKWDDIYIKYKPLFAQLQNFDTSNENRAEQYFTEMTSGLTDAHFNLNFKVTGNSFSPYQWRKMKLNPNWFTDSIFPTYLLNTIAISHYIDSSTLKIGADNLSSGGLGNSLLAISGTINNKILYLYFNSFNISQAGQNTMPVFDYFFSLVHNLPPNIKGIVIDLRGNPGGEVVDLDYILGQMITKPLTYGFTRTKKGANRLDYTPWAPAIVKPWNGGTNIEAPIIILGDHGTTSLAELTAIAVKSLPNGRYIGTNTWGATGPVSEHVYFNSGSFNIGTPFWGPNGYMSIYTSAAMFKDINGTSYENEGISPDIYAFETEQAYSNDHDLVLDAAIQYINSQ